MNLTRCTEFTYPGMPAAPRSCLPGRTRDLGRSVWNDVLPRSRRSKAGQQYGEPVGMGIQTLGSVSVFDFRCLQDDLVRLCRHIAETPKQESNGSARFTQDEPGYRA